MIRRFIVALLIAAQLFGSIAHAAIADYAAQASFLWFADSNANSDKPTGSTKANPTGLTDPALSGSPDSVADFALTNGITFTTPTPTGEVGTGDITLIGKFQLDTSSAGRVIAENFDGSGTNDTATGWQISNTTGTSRRIGLAALPKEASVEKTETADNSHTLGAPFIVAFRRSSGTWTVWVDADASGGMVANTPATNNLGSNDVFSEMGDVTFGSRRTAANPCDCKVFWFAQIEAAVSDADIQLAAWDDEANVKAGLLGAGDPSVVPAIILQQSAANEDSYDEPKLVANSR